MSKLLLSKFPELPKAKKKAYMPLGRVTLLVYGEPGIGKTSFFASWPKAIFATTEPGTKGQSIYEYNSENGGCTSWEHLLALVTHLEKSDKFFRTVVIDTVDRAYDMCSDYICNQLGIDYPGVDSAGNKDYGKSWKEIRREFTGLVYRIIQSGRGLCMTSHSTEVTIKPPTGEEFNKIVPSFGESAMKVIKPLVDYGWYAQNMRDPQGNIIRAFATRGTDIIWAKGRKGHSLPALIPFVEDENGYSMVKSAWEGEDIGINPNTLRPSKSASKVVVSYFNHLQVALHNEAVRAKKKKKKLARLRKEEKDGD